MDLALAYGCPVVGINDSGAHASRKASSLCRVRGDLLAQRPRFRVCRRSACHGAVQCGAVYSPAITDFVLHGRGVVVHVHHRP